MSDSRPFIGRGRGRGNFNENAHVESRTFRASSGGRENWTSGNSHQQDDWRSKQSSEADDWGVNDVPPVKRSHQDSNWKSSLDDDWNVGKVPDRPKPETKNNDWEDEWLKDDTPKPQQQASYQSATIQQSADTRIIRVANGRVGSVIGRGGSKIKELQDRSGARIKVLRDDDNGADTGVTITGSTEEQQLAENMIRDLTEDHTRSENDYPERRSGGSGYVPPGTIIVKVPSDCVGKIIGRGGSKIQDLQEKSGARIKVPRNDDGAYEVDVQISGDPDKQAAAEALIKELLNENPYSSNKASYSAAPAAMDEEDPTQIDWTVVIKNSIEATKARWAKAAPINKCFYIEEPEVALASRDDVEKFKLEHNNIMTSHYKKDDDRPIPNPVRKFSQAFVHYPEILQAVSSQGFSDPSPIQCQSWPILLKGYDMIGIAQTGTGKTLAFLLPALVHIESQPTPRDQRDGPTVLVMAPTRELAQQIEREVRKFPYKGITCVCVYGGGDRRQQMSTVAKGVEIVVATPGRLYDLMTAGALKTSSVSYVVLDEADRMLDLGFEPQIKKILIDVRPDRQTIMTSATWPEGIRRIANEYMDNPIQVCVGTLDLAAVHSITQYVEIIAEEDKRQRLMDFIKNLEKTDKAIVFVGRKLVADQIASELSLSNVVCQCIHGDRDQIDREQALADLRNGDVNLLIATDVASRGIDIKDITHILNYDFPRHAEEYVHRVGRTGRAGRSGIAISFMTREDWSKAPDLISILEEAGQEVPEELRTMSERYAAWKVRKDEERARDKLDSGRGGGGRGCHKCGQEGHFARECPTGGGGGGRGGGSGGGRGCHKCGEEGHFARECPSGGGGGRGGGGGARRGYSGSSSSGPGPKRGSFGRDFF